MPRLDQLLKLRDQDPSDPDIPYMLAQEYAKQSEHQNAISAYDQCIELDPHYHYAYYHKAKTLEARGDEQGAIQTLRTGLQQAQAAGNAKAIGEIQTFLDGLA